MKRFFPMSYVLFFTIGALLTPFVQANANYCLAVRGNGQLMPAHWGGISAIVENKGLPRALAGGSSASITIFLIESLAINTWAKNRLNLVTKSERNEAYSLFVKSFQGYIEALGQTNEANLIRAIMADQSKLRELFSSIDSLDDISDFDFSHLAEYEDTLQNLLQLLTTPSLTGLINAQFRNYVFETFELIQLASNGLEVNQDALDFRISQIRQAIKEFGKFNAQTDLTLFFRPGIFDFYQLAKEFSLMADFYAGRRLSDLRLQRQIDARLDQFLLTCSPGSNGKTWGELSEERPNCQKLIIESVLLYREGVKSEEIWETRGQDNIGSHLLTFPMTSILIGEGREKALEKKASFYTNTHKDFGANFLISERDLRFAYWGNEDVLKRVESTFRLDELFSFDEKSSRFYSLGDATWFEALSTSPAEPGLSNFVNLRDKYISAGGWNDLHPTLILEASGCEEIIYLTRQGGESFFAQGVIKRLIDIDGFSWERWEGLSQEERWELNLKGDEADVGPKASLWSRLYNMANPESSIRFSMSRATSIVCTEWDSYSVYEGLDPLIENAYRAPWVGPEGSCP